MGKEKGNVYENAVFLKTGDMLYEFSNFSNFGILKLVKYLKKKPPFKFKYAMFEHQLLLSTITAYSMIN